MNHIHTIPVLDALREPGGCAFCVMQQNLEKTSVQFIMSPAYMEDDVRAETNRVGFCARHLAAMYDTQNRLGLALMLHTHLLVLNKDMEKLSKSPRSGSFFGKDASGPVAKLRDHLSQIGKRCYVCERVEATFARYIDTFFHLWGKGGDEAKLIKSQPGYCLPHFIQLLDAAAGFGKGKREKFLADFVHTQQKWMQELADDLEWFTQKFDHRNADLPWNNAKDALVRAVALLGGTS
ncbi:MAG: DUF6062 family protein [Defluviitaleaceae bacterium]|nr:DUF6062 family protein [Defluviitaleaceae bacterium]MCL2239482.1 DUF6062 family protein [Defluviitaleaceae bacterium]